MKIGKWIMKFSGCLKRSLKTENFTIDQIDLQISSLILLYNLILLLLEVLCPCFHQIIFKIWQSMQRQVSIWINFSKWVKLPHQLTPNVKAKHKVNKLALSSPNQWIMRIKTNKIIKKKLKKKIHQKKARHNQIPQLVEIMMPNKE